MTPQDLDIPPRSRLAIDTMALLSKKWHPVIVVTLQHHGPLGFNELLERIPNVSGKVLSESLEALQDPGVVERRELNESPLRVEYDLTDAGRAMEPIFESLGTWGERYLESANPSVLLADADRRITELYGQWLNDRFTVLRAHNGEELEARLDERVDVVLLDEGLPGTDTRRFVSEVGRDCWTVLLVGDRPDFDLLGVSCDHVLRKPIVRETAIEVIDEQLARRSEPPEKRELASLSAKRSLFESVYAEERLAATEKYHDFSDNLEELESRHQT